jgi:hypothetical protein
MAAGDVSPTGVAQNGLEGAFVAELKVSQSFVVSGLKIICRSFPCVWMTAADAKRGPCD